MTEVAREEGRGRGREKERGGERERERLEGKKMVTYGSSLQGQPGWPYDRVGGRTVSFRLKGERTLE